MIATESKHEQRSEGWHSDRAGRATATGFNTIIVAGAGAETYKAELVGERVAGYVTETFQSKAMLDGVERENLARLEYKLKTKNEVLECGFFKHNEILAGASPDGLVNDDGLVEIKCPTDGVHLKTLHTGKIPNGYYWQMMGQMWMTERSWCDYVSYNPKFGNASLFIKRVHRDEAEIVKLDKAVRNFLEQVATEVEFVRSYER